MQWRILKPAGILLTLTLWLSIGCERITVDPDTARSGYDYYPVSEGSFRIYDVYRINYNFATENDTLQYEVKEKIMDSYLNQQGDTSYILHRLSRVGQETSWKLDSVYHIRRTELQAVELNNNRPVVKMVFPLEEGKTWNSNFLNTTEADSFKMVEVHKPFQIGDKLFDSTVKVVQQDVQDTIVVQDVRQEVYGLHIGPIYRLVKNLNYCSTPDCIGMGIVNSGIFEEMKLKDYGSE